MNLGMRKYFIAIGSLFVLMLIYKMIIFCIVLYSIVFYRHLRTINEGKNEIGRTLNSPTREK